MLAGTSILSVPDALPAYNGTYIGTYRSLISSILATAYNTTAGELIVAGNVLKDGSPGIQGLDPTTFAVRWSLATPSAGDVIAVSDDGSKAFVGQCPQKSIAQINLLAHTIDSVFQIGSPSQNICAGDIQVQPGSPMVIAVTQIAQGTLAPRSVGTAMFNNGVPLPNAVNEMNSSFYVSEGWTYTSSVKLRFFGPNTLVGYSDYTTTPQVQRYAVSAAGITLTGIQLADTWGENLSTYNDNLVFGFGVTMSAADLSGIKYFRQCSSGVGGVRRRYLRCVATGVDLRPVGALAATPESQGHCARNFVLEPLW